MAKMAFREDNRARWVGVRPGHDGEQAVKTGVATNALTVVYTVPAGKILLVNAFCLSVYVPGAGCVQAHLDRGGPVEFLLGFLSASTLVGWVPSIFGSFPIPYELGAGKNITIESTAVTISGALEVHGILIPA